MRTQKTICFKFQKMTLMKVRLLAKKTITKLTNEVIEILIKNEKLEAQIKELEANSHEFEVAKRSCESENSQLKKHVNKLESENVETAKILETRKSTMENEIEKLILEKKVEKDQWENVRESLIISAI